jgi:hypothetical protein
MHYLFSQLMQQNWREAVYGCQPVIVARNVRAEAFNRIHTKADKKVIRPSLLRNQQAFKIQFRRVFSTPKQSKKHVWTWR